MSSTETAAPVLTRPSEPTLADVLAEVRPTIDRVLQELPEIRQEARKVISHEFGFNPTPEQLKSIDSMAHGPASQGVMRDLLRSALALRLVASRALENLLLAPELVAERIRPAGRLVPELRKALRSLEDDVRSGVKGLAPADRECLLQITHALMPAREPLITAEVLAPRLELLVLARQQGELASAVPSLTDEDVALVRAAVASDETWSNGASRVCINALTLRTIIEEDLTSWEMFKEVLSEDAKTPGTRAWNLARLERDRVAYEYVTERLQKQQDTALVAGLRDFADHLRRVKGELFSVYLQLAPVLREAKARPSERANGDEAAALGLDTLLDEIEDLQRVEKVTTDELYVGALKGLDSPSAAPVPVARSRTAKDLRRERRRFKVLVSAAAVLFVVVAVEYWLLLRPKKAPDLRLPVEEFAGKLMLSEAIAVGPMMYAQVSHHLWDPLTPSQREQHLQHLGERAVERGFDQVYLTDETNRHLASWSKKSGAELQ